MLTIVFLHSENDDAGKSFHKSQFTPACKKYCTEENRRTEEIGHKPSHFIRCTTGFDGDFWEKEQEENWHIKPSHFIRCTTGFDGDCWEKEQEEDWHIKPSHFIRCTTGFDGDFWEKEQEDEENWHIKPSHFIRCIIVVQLHFTSSVQYDFVGVCKNNIIHTED